MRITRFEFNQLHDFRPRSESFSFEQVVEEMAQEQITVPEKPTFSEAQLEDAKSHARTQGYNEGHAAGVAATNQELLQREQDTKLALDTLAGQISDMHKGYEQILVSQSKDINQFVIAIARKLAGEALNNRPDLAIQELINQCLPILVQKPRLVLEANSSLVALLDERLRPLLERSGFEGEVHFRINDKLQPSDTRLEWAGGHAERSTEHLWKEIEEMLSHVTFYPHEITHNNSASQAEIKE